MKAAPAALLIATALAGAAAGFLSYRHLARSSTGLVPITPAATPAPSASTAAPAIPELVPDLSLQDLAGRPHALRENDGHARLFNFWATWCEPCRREIPLLNELQSAHAADGLRIVGVAVDFRDSVQTFVRTTQLHYQLLVGEEDGLEAAQKFGMELLLPFSVFADEHNRIVAVKVGELHRDEAEAILAQLRLLRAGQTSLPAAREAISATLKRLSLERTKQSDAR